MQVRTKHTDKLTDFYQNSLFAGNTEIERADYNIPFLERFIPANKAIRILDAGCGNGKYANYLYGKGYHNLVAVDLYDSIVFDQIPYLKARVESLPFHDNEFDVVYSNSVIYHLQQPENAILEFKRVLKPGGILIFSGHTRYSLHTLWRKLKILLKRKSVENLSHARFYSTRRYLRFLRENGFGIVHVDGFRLGFLLYPYYRRKIKWFEIHWNIRLPLVKPRVSGIRIIGRLSAAFAYHFVIVCSKK